MARISGSPKVGCPRAMTSTGVAGLDMCLLTDGTGPAKVTARSRDYVVARSGSARGGADTDFCDGRVTRAEGVGGTEAVLAVRGAVAGVRGAGAVGIRGPEGAVRRRRHSSWWANATSRLSVSATSPVRR